jgi:hypothetical protein
MKEVAEEYEGLREFVLETTYGCYSDYGWMLAAYFDDIEDAKKSCDHWTGTGGEYRVVSSGEVVYKSE